MTEWTRAQNRTTRRKLLFAKVSPICAWAPKWSNAQHQRCEPAANDARTAPGANGWLASAEWCGSAPAAFSCRLGFVGYRDFIPKGIPAHPVDATPLRRGVVAEAKCKTFSGCLVPLDQITEDRTNLKTAVAQRITAINVLAGVSVASGLSPLPRVYALPGFLDRDQASLHIRKCGLECCPCVKHELGCFEILLGLLPSFGCGHRLGCG